MLTKPKYSDLFAYDNIFIREVFQGRREALAQDGQELLADVGGDQGFSGNLFFTGRDGAGRGGEPPPPRGEDFPRGGESNPGGNLILRCFT